jgi:hypothetical protein
MVAGLFRSRAALQAEILVLRHQLIVLRRRSPKRLVLSNIDRLVLVNLYRFSPRVLDALAILKPATVIAADGLISIALRAIDPAARSSGVDLAGSDIGSRSN